MTVHSGLNDVIAKFRERFSSGVILTNPIELNLYSCDGLRLHSAVPGCVIFPESTEDIQFIVRTCNEYHVPYTARGAGTGLSGGATSDAGVIIQLSRLNQILETDYSNRCAMVQPGVVNSYLSMITRPAGFYFAPDPSSQIASTIGGNVAENAGGPHTLKYGVTTDHVLGLTTVLPTGEVLTVGGKERYQEGVDLTSLMTGSEGTLGIITEIIVNLEKIPASTRTFLLVFDHMTRATDTVSAIIEKGILPAALEMIDNLCIQAVEAKLKAGFPIDAEAVLLVELDGSVNRVQQDAEILKELVAPMVSQPVQEALTAEKRAKLWRGRKHAAGSMGQLSPAFYTNDGVVPRHQLTNILEEIYRIGRDYNLRIANLCHAGDGNIHPLILYDPQKKDEVKRSIDCSGDILHTCLNFGGSLTGEHGIGAEKNHLIPQMFSEAHLTIMKNIKKVFDPLKLANPDKIFPVSSGCGELSRLSKKPVLS